MKDGNVNTESTGKIKFSILYNNRFIKIKSATNLRELIQEVSGKAYPYTLKYPPMSMVVRIDSEHGDIVWYPEDEICPECHNGIVITDNNYTTEGRIARTYCSRGCGYGYVETTE